MLSSHETESMALMVRLASSRARKTLEPFTYSSKQMWLMVVLQEFYICAISILCRKLGGLLDAFNSKHGEKSGKLF